MLGFQIKSPGSNKTNGENNLSFTVSEEMKQLYPPTTAQLLGWNLEHFRVEINLKPGLWQKNT